MKTRKIWTILGLALGFAVWPASMASGGQSLTVNDGALDSIILKLGQTCTVEVVSDDASPYDAYVGFDDGAVLGTFSHLQTMPEAGDLNDVTEYNVPAFYGYYVEAAGSAPAPSPGVHFAFEYRAAQFGETDLKLYDQTLISVIASMHITVVGGEMGTAFTYQGRLLDANEAGDGLYDFLFALYDAPSDGNQFGIVTDTNEVIVIDGYFTVELDFGSSVSDGNAVWLEIGVRPGAESDPCEYTILEPRQELTSVPYALHTRWLRVDTALNNVFLGEEAGASNTTGQGNSAMGVSALYSNTEGNYNSAIGNQALHDNTEGNYNSAMGYAALNGNTTGIQNSAMGYVALNKNTEGNYNSAMGNYALFRNTTGIYNSAIGYDALRGNSTGNYNVGVGAQANYFNQEGSYNTIIGFQAGKGASEHNKSGNVFIGYRAGYTETGSNKLYIANSDADPPLIYGDFSTGSVGIGTTSPTTKLDVAGTVNATAFVGDGSGLTGIVTGDSGWTISGNDMYSIPDGNVGIGTSGPGDKLDVEGHINSSESYKLDGQTVLSNTGTVNILVGKGAGVNITTAGWNSAVGNYALCSNTEGNYNSAMGSSALYANTTGDRNSAMGFVALSSNTTGISNSAVGYYALFSNTEGYYNSAMGSLALYANTTGGENSAMGYAALNDNNEGNYNSAMGCRALYSNTTGWHNSAVGYRALYSNTTGHYNSAMGDRAGYSNSTGSRNVFLGYRAGYDETGSGKLYIANSEVDPPLIYGDFSTGRVGIGTTSPSAKLEVGGTPGVDGIRFPDGTLQTTAALGGGGDITAVNAGTGLSGGGASGDVTLDVNIPLSLSSSSSGGIIRGTNNQNSGYGVYGEATGYSGYGVYGLTSRYELLGTGYGGYFVSRGGKGYGVYGEAGFMDTSTNYGGYFKANGYYGRGVYGEATYLGSTENYGGYFVAKGYTGRGVCGEANTIGFGNVNYGGHFTAGGTDGRGVYGYASNTGDYTNYGGYFEALGSTGRGVYGYASNNSGNYENFGGYFKAEGYDGKGVYGEATGAAGRGVQGEGGTNGVGVHGEAPSKGVYGKETLYGSYGYLGFSNAAGRSYGVYGYGSTIPADAYAGKFDGRVAVTTMPIIVSGETVAWSSANGQIGIDGSSSRFKEDIRPVEDDFNKILQADPKSYRSKISGAEDIGFIAEEFDSLGLNKLVRYRDGAPSGIKYNKVPLYLLQVVKEQQRRIAELEELRAENDSLTQRVEALERVMQRLLQRKELGL